MTVSESYGLEKIQSVLLIALKKFDQLCRQNNISYALHGGTLLGAERNHKFIPWDDDIDVSMKRSEFKKFCNVAKDLTGEFELDEKTMWFPRLVMRTDSDVVYVDILLWDYISSNKLAQFAKINLLRFFQGMMKTHIEYERFGLFNKFLLFTTHTVGMIIPQAIKLKMFNFLCEKAFVGNKKFIHRSNDAFKGVSYIFDSEYMNGYTNIEFEGDQFMVNRRYHEFLERNYGADYLTPPPIEQRIPEHEKFRKDL